MRGVPGITEDSWSILFAPSDSQLEEVPPIGVSLLDCFCHLPHMRDFVLSHHVQHRTVRAKVERLVDEPNGSLFNKLTIHPENVDVLSEFYGNFAIEPRAVDTFKITELMSGLVIEAFARTGYPRLSYNIPAGVVWDREEVRFWPTHQPLNEFGFFYVALFIAGNLARYYPDIWLREIDRSTPLVLGIEELLRGVAERMIMLALSEMRRVLFVIE